MYIKLLNRCDSLAGLFFILMGGLTIFLASDYPLGTAMRMGSGYFPLVLGAALCVLGVVVLLRSVRIKNVGNLAPGALAWRPLAFIVAGVVAFGLLTPNVGLLAAIVVLTLLSGLARREAQWRELLGLSAVLSLFGVGVFAYGLGLPLPVWPV